MPQDIEQEIQAKGLTAPRVTPADIEAAIASEHYFTGDDGVRATPEGVELDEIPEPLRLLTFCVLVLRNGFTVTGQSACASPENFDAEIGRKIARQDAVNQMWPLLGYALREKLHAGTAAGAQRGLHPNSLQDPHKNMARWIMPDEPWGLWWEPESDTLHREPLGFGVAKSLGHFINGDKLDAYELICAGPRDEICALGDEYMAKIHARREAARSSGHADAMPEANHGRVGAPVRTETEPEHRAAAG